MSERLRQAIVNLVVPGAFIEDSNEHYATITTKTISPEQQEMVARLSEVGIDISISAWPAGVLVPKLDDKTKVGSLVLRFAW